MKAALLLTFLAAGLAAQTITFDSDRPGSVPAGWTSAMTHEGGAPKWEVVQDNTAPSKPNVFAQTSTDATGGRSLLRSVRNPTSRMAKSA